MAGGLMQLVAYGAQDVYLTGQPKVTFFQAVYKRHTNFAMENIQQTVNGTTTNSGRVSVTIARNGDLVGNMYVTLFPATANTTSNNAVFDTNWIAERALADIEMTIGGQRIDKHYQNWWRLYSEVFLNESDKYCWGKMTSTAAAPTNITATSYTNQPRVYLPLLFFFNRNPGLYLPLIALQYHEVRLDFDLSSYYLSYFSTDFQVWANYVYLDTEERRRFAQKGHEYLIEQVQHTGGDSVSPNDSFQLIRLSFNHPVKEFIWCYVNPNYPGTASSGAGSNLNSLWNFCTSTQNVQVTCNTSAFVNSNNYVLAHVSGMPHLYFSGTKGAAPSAMPEGTIYFAGGASAVAGSGNTYNWIEEGVASAAYQYEVGPLDQFKVILNGQDRFKEQLGKYFNQYQPFVYHSGCPYPGIYVYSFALQPEEHQPTGTCNFSRIDNAQVAVALKTNTMGIASTGTVTQKLFAVNYNILRIQSGMGGLAFSN